MNAYEIEHKLQEARDYAKSAMMELQELFDKLPKHDPHTQLVQAALHHTSIGYHALVSLHDKAHNEMYANEDW